jgi:hypothetical protein
VTDLVDVPFAQVALDDALEPDDDRQDVFLDGSHEDSENVEINGVALALARVRLRTSTITDLAWVDGTLLVAGVSNEEFASTLRRIPFPFGNSGPYPRSGCGHAYGRDVQHGRRGLAVPPAVSRSRREPAMPGSLGSRPPARPCSSTVLPCPRRLMVTI